MPNNSSPSHIKIDSIKAFKGDRTKLGTPELFFIAVLPSFYSSNWMLNLLNRTQIMDIPRLKQRLECIVFRKELKSSLDEINTVRGSYIMPFFASDAMLTPGPVYLRTYVSAVWP